MSLVIKKSILIKENKSINTELNWENKKLISDFIKETNPDTLSLSNDFDIDVSELEYFKEILNSNLILSNKANINSRIFSSNSKYYFAAPDNLILLNKVSIIVEEKFRKATNDFAITEPFTNHIIETLNSITNIEDLKNNSAYIIYWIWTFENTFEEENKIKFKIKKAKIFKIIPNKESIELLHHYLNKLKNLYNNNSEEFSTKILSAKKCVACSVRDYCLHKTGRISTISFPYEKIELNKIIPILNNR